MLKERKIRKVGETEEYRLPLPLIDKQIVSVRVVPKPGSLAARGISIIFSDDGVTAFGCEKWIIPIDALKELIVKHAKEEKNKEESS